MHRRAPVVIAVACGLGLGCGFHPVGAGSGGAHDGGGDQAVSGDDMTPSPIRHDLAMHDAALPADGSWTVESVGGLVPLTAVYARSDNDVYVFGTNGFITHSSGDGNWSSNVDSPGISATLAAAASGGGGSIVVAGHNGIALSNAAGQWTQLFTGTTSIDFYAVAQRDGQVVVAGAGSWIDELVASGSPNRFQWIVGGDPWNAALAIGNDTYIVGTQLILRKSGSKDWQQNTISADAIAFGGIWGSSPSDLYVVGQHGAVYHSTGQDDWIQVGVGVSVDLNCVGGTGPTDVWMAGQNATVLHWTGSVWKPIPTGMIGPLLAISVGTHDIYITGNDGKIAHGRR